MTKIATVSTYKYLTAAAMAHRSSLSHYSYLNTHCEGYQRLERQSVLADKQRMTFATSVKN